jgi:flagellar biosynthesis/type III secretory pathway ATPase
VVEHIREEGAPKVLVTFPGTPGLRPISVLEGKARDQAKDITKPMDSTQEMVGHVIDLVGQVVDNVHRIGRTQNNTVDLKEIQRWQGAYIHQTISH